MMQLTAETIKALALQIYGYEMNDAAAGSVAHMVGAMATYCRKLEALPLGGVQPPFGYPNLLAEAARRAGHVRQTS